MFEASPIFEANYNSQSRIVINQGGTSSGKTYAILQVLCSLAIQESDLIITVVGQDVPNLKAGPIRDVGTIIRESPILKTYVDRYNKSDRELHFTNGSMIEFKSYDDEQDARSGKRNYLFINEANAIDYEIFKQLHMRCTRPQTRSFNKTFLDYNPSSAFWVQDVLLVNKELYPSTELFISDHRHNPFLPEEVHESIERLKFEDEETWKVYARGLTGRIHGLIFKNWYVMKGNEEIPATAKIIANGLDFGFTNDETGCLEVFISNGELWVNELIYETALTNQDISGKLTGLGVSKNREIVADSAEPKSIEELRRLGWNIKEAKKGADSIKNSIDILKRYKINVTANSVNLRKELNRYVWKKDRTGKTLNEPIDKWNHLIDPLRYVALNKLRINSVGGVRTKLPSHRQQAYNPHSDLLSDMLGM